MPNIGGKIWFTAIAGLLLGFVLFGMIQRGCDAQGEGTIATASDPAEPPTRDFNPASRNNARTYAPPSNSNSNGGAATGRRSGARANAGRTTGRNTRTSTSTRKESLERSERTRSQADSARKAELARLTRERTEKYRERSRQTRAGDPNTIDPALRSSTTGVGIEDSVAQAAAEAGDELRGQRGEGGSGSGGSGGGGDAGGGGGNGSDDGGPGDSGDGGADAESDALAALLAGLGIDQSFIDLIQQVISGAIPPVNPFDNNNGNNNGNNDNGNNNNGNGNNDNGGGDADPDEPVDLTTPVLARWVPVTQSGCSTLTNRGLETRDLYLAFLVKPIGPPVLSSKEENSIVILDGSFYQAPLGTNGPPTIATDDCAQYDSYLTIGKAAPVFLTAPDSADWGDRLQAEWFAIFGVEITQNRAAFGNDRFYVHVGRFTAESGAKIFGKLRVDYAGQLAFVAVPDWKGANTDGLDGAVPPPLPKVASVGVESSGVLGGASLLGTVTIDRPAPAGGLLISLTTNKPGRVKLPLNVLIPQGELAAMFEIKTIATGVVETSTITAIASNSQKSTTLILQAPGLLSFEALKLRLLGGQSTSAVIRLSHPADAGGTTVLLTVDNPGSVSIPTIARIPAGQFRTVVTITGRTVGALTRTRITATAGGVSRDIEFEIVPLSVVDINGDGVVDTADLGLFIGAFGSNNPVYDFNGDGVVDTADLGILNAQFGNHVDPGGGDDDPVIARWIEIPQDDCDEFPGTRTAELFVGFLTDGVLPVMSSNAEHGITVSNGAFVQHQYGSNGPPSDALIALFPCTKYDSFLSVGEAPAVILGILDPVNWGATLNAAWFSINGTSTQDPSKFGDNRHYVRIGRFTAPTIATISGSVRIDYAGALAIVEVPDWATAAAIALDLNFDGQVDSADVGIVTRAYGTSNSEYDFDGDGLVDGDDLRPLLRAIQANQGR